MVYFFSGTKCWVLTLILRGQKLCLLEWTTGFLKFISMFSHLRLVFSLKIWQFDSEALEEAVKLSYTHDTLKTKTVFPTGDFFFPFEISGISKSFLRAVSLPWLQHSGHSQELCWLLQVLWRLCFSENIFDGLYFARWFGDFVLSKSCENSIVCWKPGTLSQDQQNEREREQRSTIIHKLDVGIIFTFLSADIL